MNFFKSRNKETPVRRQPTLMSGQDAYTFRRSRTLTGSLSSEVRTIAEDHSQLKSPRLKLHQLQRHRRLVATGLGLSLILVVGLGWLVGQFIRLPDDITYTQALNAQPDSAQYNETIQKYFAIHPTERFLFRLQPERLTDFVSDNHAEVESVVVEKRTVGAFDVAFVLRQPVLSWRSGDSQLYVDTSGVPFRDNYFTEPRVAVDDRSGIKLEDTNVVASNRFIEFLGRIVGGVSQAGLNVDKVIIPAGTTREVDLQLASRAFPIKTHIDREPSSQAQDVVNAVRYLDSKQVVPQYIDVRIAGKAFYQ